MTTKKAGGADCFAAVINQSGGRIEAALGLTPEGIRRYLGVWPTNDQEMVEYATEARLWVAGIDASAKWDGNLTLTITPAKTSAKLPAVVVGNALGIHAGAIKRHLNSTLTVTMEARHLRLRVRTKASA